MLAISVFALIGRQIIARDVGHAETDRIRSRAGIQVREEEQILRGCKESND